MLKVEGDNSTLNKLRESTAIQDRNEVQMDSLIHHKVMVLEESSNEL